MHAFKNPIFSYSTWGEMYTFFFLNKAKLKLYLVSSVSSHAK